MQGSRRGTRLGRRQDAWLSGKLDAWLETARHLHLAEFVRYATDRKARIRDAFWQGVARGLGAMVGFAVLGTLLTIILQKIAAQNLPVISDFLAQVVVMVQNRTR